MKRDILFLCQFFYPEYNSSATLPFDTSRYLAQRGYSVGALCGYPKEYNASGEVPAREMKDGVSIRRLHYMQLSRRNKLGRLINYFSFTLSVLFHIFEIKDCQAVIAYSNPPILPVAAILANKLFHTKVIFVSYDVYPEVAVATNSLKEGSAAANVMQAINRSLFRRAKAVVSHQCHGHDKGCHGEKRNCPFPADVARGSNPVSDQIWQCHGFPWLGYSAVLRSDPRGQVSDHHKSQYDPLHDDAQ